MKPQKVPSVEDMLSREQEKTRTVYRALYGLSENEADMLHRFFSPQQVPKGLTESEVRMTFLLQDAVRVYRERRLAKRTPDTVEVRGEISSYIRAVTLPPGLDPTRKITREGFKRGVLRLLREAAKK